MLQSEVHLYHILERLKSELEGVACSPFFGMIVAFVEFNSGMSMERFLKRGAEKLCSWFMLYSPGYRDMEIVNLEVGMTVCQVVTVSMEDVSMSQTLSYSIKRPTSITFR